MIINGQYVKLEEITSVVPIGNMGSTCRVTFKSGEYAVLRCYTEIMEALIEAEL